VIFRLRPDLSWCREAVPSGASPVQGRLAVRGKPAGAERGPGALAGCGIGAATGGAVTGAIDYTWSKIFGLGCFASKGVSRWTLFGLSALLWGR
jgi:hypothetical protein